MTRQELAEKLTYAVVNDPENAIQKEYALRPELAGTVYYDAPLLGIAAADDPLFAQMKEDPKIFGPVLRLPEEWLNGAKSVVSFFLPFSEKVRRANTPNLRVPSAEWLHGRIEGQAFMLKTCHQVADWLRQAGYQAVVPADHPDFRTECDYSRLERGEPAYASTWSERHAAYAAGLGTFSLSKHLITERGLCGRFGSVITDAPLEVTPRPYTDPYEYCTFCGACVPRCPVKAISVEKGKNIKVCAKYTAHLETIYCPYFGCGKCQLDIPCEDRIPDRAQGQQGGECV